MSKKVFVIGGGIAGMESSAYLSAMGYEVVLIEKADKLGGKLLKWEQLFPAKRHGSEVLSFLSQGVNGHNNIKILFNTEVSSIIKNETKFYIETNNQKFEADAILIATGYDLFDARRKEEYGFGIYDNVITSAELEEFLISRGEPKTPSGKIPKSIGFVHCVGSRDEKVGNVYCSKVCCVTAVKQAIEAKEVLPDIEAYCFYMDMRMFGMQFEELYLEAQELGVQFIRGRLSEACENADKSILVKIEDTLTGRPMKLSVDLLVLMVGFEASEGTKKLGKMLNLQFNTNGFLKSADEHTMTNVSSMPGIFLAGSCTAPRTITNTITDARAAAAKIASYLQAYSIENRTNR